MTTVALKYRSYYNGGLDADTDFSLIENGRWVNAENIRTFSTDSGATNRIESIGGNVLLENPYLPDGDNLTLGGCSDDKNNRFFFANWNSNGDHAIFCYSKTDAVFYKVLLNAQVTGGLNFDKYHLIHSIRYIDNKLYWTDDLNEPRRINTEAGIKLNHAGYTTTVLSYTDPLPQWAITIIRRSAYYPLTVTKKTDGAYDNNFLVNEASQYAIRYLFRDYEYSVIGPYSTLIPYNQATETNNYVEIKMSLTEFIDQDILEAELVVKLGNTAKPSVVHTWTKTDIDAHNAGTPLSFNFYNDIVGITIDDVSAVKAFESIALLAQALEVAKNRVFLGNLNEGYSTPTSSSLTTTIATADTGADSATGNWYIVYFYYNDATTGDFSTQTYYVFYVPVLSPSYYTFGYGPPVATVDVTVGVIHSTSSIDDMIALLSADLVATGVVGTMISNELTLLSDTSVVLSTTIVLDGRRGFKSNGIYMTAIWFFDKYRRKCGVVYVAANKLKMPERTYAQTEFNLGINWALDNTAALTEIPDWASYYTIGRTKCLTTDFFIEARSQQSFYVKRNDDLSYDYSTTGYSSDLYGVAIDISTIIGFGMGYVFDPSSEVQDLVNLYFSSGPTGKQEMSILAQDGKWLIVNLKDLGTLGASVKPLFEIYTPSKQLLNEPFYEVGNIYEVLDPGLSTRRYGATSGTLNGDIYILKRDSVYYTENMSPNDKLWTKWQTDIGWPNAIDKIGNVTIKNKISFSDVYLQGTKVNGLSSFQTLNAENIGSDGGPIYKLQLASKVQVDGSVMLCLCQDETFSIYLGEQEVFDTQGSTFIAKANAVLGSDKALKGSYGTINPESVVLYNGKVWWYDSRNSGWIQYADNLLFNLANNRFTRPTNLFSLQFRTLTVSEIETLGSRPYVVGGYDPKHKELLFSIPATESTPPKGNLADFSTPDIPYPYDIYDGKEKTFIYKQERDMWFGSMPIQQEKFIRLGNELYSFKAGNCYIHNQPQPAFFNGTQFKARIMCCNNPKGENTFKNIAIDGNKPPTFVHLRTENPFVQSSSLEDTDFSRKEGIEYVPIQRDRLSPNHTGNFDEKEKIGDKLFGNALLYMLEYSFDDTIPLELRFTTLIFKQNAGQLI